ncbi:hypothetical protein [Psychrobacter aestuarii]|uniref:Uncharacterized protein n=1 Tax=Psychrobacter aestuarii TaxID=556327 RepID=A0ABP3F830_9GAMM|nr:hypothetical protein [Psychrobacter aestuarii]
MFFDDTRAEFYQQLKRRERYWWRSRQRLIKLKERHMFWFGENSFMMWVLWQLVGYVLIAIVMMLINRWIQGSVNLWSYAVVFVVQTLLFLALLLYKSRFAATMQDRIDSAAVVSEEALQEMYILAADSLFPDIHAHAPISLQGIYERYHGELHLISLQQLLQKEVEAGRLLLAQQQADIYALPLELANDDLAASASKIVYKSILS